MGTTLHWPFYLLALLLSQSVLSQQVDILHEEKGVSFRGLSVVDDRTLWVSGSKGTVGISSDAGNNWHFFSVPGYEDRDFRDIEAWDGHTAVIMAVAEPAVILRTRNSGKTWTKVYENRTPGMFLDAIDFRDKNHGRVIGDPINGHFFTAFTADGGRSWQEADGRSLIMADSGEACFAASGTNLRVLEKNTLFVSGGTRSRLFLNGRPLALPLLQGAATQGANSVAAHQSENNRFNIIVSGGDFSQDTLPQGNCVVSRDGGDTWITPSNPPRGYRSCVEFINDTHAITCGLTGVDVSFDQGINWNNISSTGFHVCRKAKKGNAVFLAGADGRIGRVRF